VIGVVPGLLFLDVAMRCYASTMEIMKTGREGCDHLESEGRENGVMTREMILR
jgi:hypothetical protein